MMLHGLLNDQASLLFCGGGMTTHARANTLLRTQGVLFEDLISFKPEFPILKMKMKKTLEMSVAGCHGQGYMNRFEIISLCIIKSMSLGLQSNETRCFFRMKLGGYAHYKSHIHRSFGTQKLFAHSGLAAEHRDT